PERAEIAREVDKALDLVRLPGYAKRRSWELSGGQQQRVALARALINRPTVLLLDEPLAALDRKLRREMQIELQNLQREVGITFVLVTHDQEEALSMSDTIGIMREGRVEQFASPRELYDAPANRYVADFVGESNFFGGEVVEANEAGAAIRTSAGIVLKAPLSPRGGSLAGQRLGVIAVRPEAIALGSEESLDYRFVGRVQNRIYLGDQTEFSIATEELGDILVRAPNSSRAVAGGLAPVDQTTLGWRRASALALIDA